MCGTVEVGDDLNVVTQPIIGQLLEFGGRERVGVHERRGARVLKVCVQAQRKRVDFEGRGAPNGIFQDFQMVEMHLLVPENFPVFNVRPVHELCFGQRKRRAGNFNHLNQRFRSIEQARRSIGNNGDSIFCEREFVCLAGQCRLVTVLGIAN